MIRTLVIELTLLVLVAACARQIPPTGGDRDEIAPKVILTEPDNKSLNFSGQEITLEFDEYVKEDNLLKQLIITPRLNHEYKSRLVKRQLRLLFEQPFDSGTTYTLNFREGIKDITESNPAENLKFVFSTGPYLDSLSIHGTVKNLLTGKPVKDATVSLYHADDTLDVFNSQPTYLAKTSEAGVYAIDNIKNGSYRIFASKDENQNLKTESQSEAYGFKAAPINLQDSIPSVEIALQSLDIRSPKILSARPVNHSYEIKVNKFINDYSLSTNDPNIALVSQLVDNSRTIRIYKTATATTVDSVQAFIEVVDSAESRLTDTLYVKFTDSKRALEKPTINITPENNEAIDPEYKGKLVFNKPVEHFLGDSMFIQYDSINVIAIDPNLSLVWNANRTEATLTTTLDPTLLASDTSTSKATGPKLKQIGTKQAKKAATNLEFYFGTGSFISVEGDTFPKIERSYSFKKAGEYGVIAGNVLTEYTSFVIQLVDKNLKVLETLVSKPDNPIKNYRFDGLKPGDYGFRILIDENQNGKWDYGNYLKQLEPEKIVFYVNPDNDGPTVNLIKNWELTQIDLSF
ncbi:MAG: Ig-like domain-containing protein [Cyclobacteriaceae bacterium]